MKRTDQAESPATSGKVDRAGKKGKSITNPRPAQYASVGDLVIKNPENTPSEDVLFNNLCIGEVYTIGRDQHAFGAHEQPLGIFEDYRSASTAIQKAWTRDPRSAPHITD